MLPQLIHSTLDFFLARGLHTSLRQYSNGTTYFGGSGLKSPEQLTIRRGQFVRSQELAGSQRSGNRVLTLRSAPCAVPASNHRVLTGRPSTTHGHRDVTGGIVVQRGIRGNVGDPWHSGYRARRVSIGAFHRGWVEHCWREGGESEWMSKWVCEWISEWVWMSEWASEWASVWLCEWVRENDFTIVCIAENVLVLVSSCCHRVKSQINDPSMQKNCQLFLISDEVCAQENQLKLPNWFYFYLTGFLSFSCRSIVRWSLILSLGKDWLVPA